MNAYMGDVILFASDYAPAGYAICDGSLLQIADYGDLFKVIGTTYGGDGVKTFALPDLRGRVPLGAGNGVKLGDRSAGSGAVSVGQPVQTFAPKDPRAGKGAPATLAQWNGPAGPVELPYATINYIICLEGVYPASS